MNVPVCMCVRACVCVSVCLRMCAKCSALNKYLDFEEQVLSLGVALVQFSFQGRVLGISAGTVRNAST